MTAWEFGRAGVQLQEEGKESSCMRDPAFPREFQGWEGYVRVVGLEKQLIKVLGIW